MARGNDFDAKDEAADYLRGMIEDTMENDLPSVLNIGGTLYEVTIAFAFRKLSKKEVADMDTDVDTDVSAVPLTEEEREANRRIVAEAHARLQETLRNIPPEA